MELLREQRQVLWVPEEICVDGGDAVVMQLAVAMQLAARERVHIAERVESGGDRAVIVIHGVQGIDVVGGGLGTRCGGRRERGGVLRQLVAVVQRVQPKSVGADAEGSSLSWVDILVIKVSQRALFALLRSCVNQKSVDVAFSIEHSTHCSIIC